VLTRDDLADALGWDLQRLEHSLRALRNRLQPTGQRLRRAGWNSYALTAAPAALTTRERQRLHDAASARQPLAPQAVSVLYEVTLGFRPASWHHALLAAEPAALRQLRQRSMVRLAGRNQLEPTEAVLYSLALSPNAREERS
jgi:hypothetical protein